jgi:hypothetical protein
MLRNTLLDLLVTGSRSRLREARSEKFPVPSTQLVNKLLDQLDPPIAKANLHPSLKLMYALFVDMKSGSPALRRILLVHVAWWLWALKKFQATTHCWRTLPG